MLNMNEIKELIQLINNSTIQEFELKHDSTCMLIKKNAVGVATTTIPQQAAVSSPSVSAVQAEVVVPPVRAEQPVSLESKPVTTVADNLITITSPMVGTFYAAPNPESANYVKPGDTLKKDTIVCIVEAMKLFNEIEAEVEGELVEVLVKHGQLVEYGQPLFSVRPVGGK